MAIITTDITWRSGQVYDLSKMGKIQVAFGATLTIEAGAHIINGSIEIFGKLDVKGVELNRAEFDNVNISYNGTYTEQAQINIAYADIDGGRLFNVFDNDGPGNITLMGSILKGVNAQWFTDRMSVYYPTSSVYIEGNIFYMSGGISIGHSDANVYVRNNTFIGQTGEYAVENWAAYNDTKTHIDGNNFLSTDRVALKLPEGYTSAAISASNNYYGTNVQSIIDSMIYDRTDDLGSAGVISTSHQNFANGGYTEGTNQLDTVAIKGSASNFSFTGLGDYVFVNSLTSPDILYRNVERFDLQGDVDIAFDINGTAGQAYRIYQAAFDRTPDKGGLGFWINGMDKGINLLVVAEFFMQSQEFKDAYGSAPTNRALVEKFYYNVLDREPDAGGIDFWVNHLDAGNITAAQVLAGFSESEENYAAVIGQIENGIEFTPYGG